MGGPSPLDGIAWWASPSLLREEALHRALWPSLCVDQVTMKRLVIPVLAASAALAPAQVLVSGNGPYLQRFDTLPMLGSGHPFANNNPAPGMEGWYAYTSTFGADNGSASVSDQYSYGAAASTDRAFGSVTTYGALHVVGVRMRNVSGRTFTGVDVAFMGEQWRVGGSNATDRLVFAYSLNATALTNGTWTPVTALDFLAPTQDGAARPLDGNAAANRRLRADSLAGVTWAPGQDLWLRWAHLGSGSGHGLALDDLSVRATPVPEPSGIALFVGVAAVLRRRRR